MKYNTVNYGATIFCLIALVGLLFIPLSNKPAVTTQFPNRVQEVLSSVVQIKVIGTEIDFYTNKVAKWQGSGVFIRDNLILTAGHIVAGISDANVLTVGGRMYRAKSWYLETEADIGFIEVDSCDVENPLWFQDAKLGETVWTFGNPFGVFPVLTKGIVSAINMIASFEHTKNMLISDAAVNGGNSGCPLINERGAIVGIFVWHYVFPATEGMNYFVRSEVVVAVLEKYDAIKNLERLE